MVEQFGLYKKAEADAKAASEMRLDPEMKDFADEKDDVEDRHGETLARSGRCCQEPRKRPKTGAGNEGQVLS